MDACYLSAEGNGTRLIDRTVRRESVELVGCVCRGCRSEVSLNVDERLYWLGGTGLSDGSYDQTVKNVWAMVIWWNSSLLKKRSDHSLSLNGKQWFAQMRQTVRTHQQPLMRRVSHV